MAAVAGVEIGGRRKLSRMPIFMTICAHAKLQPVQRVFALGDMALSAFNACVTPLERILGRGVLLNREKRRFPALHVVTRRTLAAISALRELPLMGILVAIRAFLEGEGLFEIPIGMTLSTFDSGMLSFERILRLGVVKLLIDALQRNLLPSTSAVTRRAGLRKAAAVRIFVAIRA